MQPHLAIEPLRADHVRSVFSCGVESMDRYLRAQANQDQRRGLAVVYVACNDSLEVLGYYTLSSLSLPLGDWPEPIRRKLPRYPQVPATLMGRLAVDRRVRGWRLGEQLLVDAFDKAVRASEQVASYAVVVDVLCVEPDPTGFYLRYGFQALPDNPRRLYLPMHTLRKSFD